MLVEAAASAAYSGLIRLIPRGGSIRDAEVIATADASRELRWYSPGCGISGIEVDLRLSRQVTSPGL